MVQHMAGESRVIVRERLPYDGSGRVDVTIPSRGNALAAIRYRFFHEGCPVAAFRYHNLVDYGHPPLLPASFDTSQSPFLSPTNRTHQAHEYVKPVCVPILERPGRHAHHGPDHSRRVLWVHADLSSLRSLVSGFEVRVSGERAPLLAEPPVCL